MPKSLNRVGVNLLSNSMRKLELNEMIQTKGGRVSTEFVIMCGILSYSLGLLTLGLGVVASFACLALKEF
jgi:hypothetical protein